MRLKARHKAILKRGMTVVVEISGGGFGFRVLGLMVDKIELASFLMKDHERSSGGRRRERGEKRNEYKVPIYQEQHTLRSLYKSFTNISGFELSEEQRSQIKMEEITSISLQNIHIQHTHSLIHFRENSNKIQINSK